MVLYRHFKGGLCLFIGIAETHEHNGDQDAVYIVLATGKMVTRPYKTDSRSRSPESPAAWTGSVKWPDGQHRPRFIPDASLTPPEMEALRRLWLVHGPTDTCRL